MFKFPIQGLTAQREWNCMCERSFKSSPADVYFMWKELNGYDLGGMRYLPDLWLPDINTFLEVKGPVTPGAEKAEALAKAVEGDWFEPKTMVIIGNELGELRIPGEDDDVKLQKCSECNMYSFISVSRSYTCRNCGAYDGDHHIKEWQDRMELGQFTI